MQPDGLPDGIRESLGADTDATTFQFVISAVPAGEAAVLRSLREAAGRSLDDLDAVRAELAVAQGHVAELEALRAGLETARTELETVRGEVETVRAEAGLLAIRVQEREAELEAIRTTATEAATEVDVVAAERDATRARELELRSLLLQAHGDLALRDQQIVPPPPSATGAGAPRSDSRARHRLPPGTRAPLVEAVPRVRCSIVVPVYGRSTLTRQCLDVLLAGTERSWFEIVVVDDGSPDGSGAQWAGYDERVSLIANEGNLGFARSCNPGAAVAEGEFLVFLNNDTLPRRGWLDALADHAEARPRAGAVGSKLLFPDGSVQRADLRTRGRPAPPPRVRGLSRRARGGHAVHSLCGGDRRVRAASS